MTKPRVDFYVLETKDSSQRWMTACRLVEKIYKQGYTVFVCLDEAEEAERLDDLLWTFRQGSFVPHVLGMNQDSVTPVVVGSRQNGPIRADVLVNLASEVPDQAGQYGRIADLVDQTPKIRSDGRSRYRQYRSQGFQIETHTL